MRESFFLYNDVVDCNVLFHNRYPSYMIRIRICSEIPMIAHLESVESDTRKYNIVHNIIYFFQTLFLL